jgi:hypothetical protein
VTNLCAAPYLWADAPVGQSESPHRDLPKAEPAYRMRHAFGDVPTPSMRRSSSRSTLAQPMTNTAPAGETRTSSPSGNVFNSSSRGINPTGDLVANAPNLNSSAVLAASA